MPKMSAKAVQLQGFEKTQLGIPLNVIRLLNEDNGMEILVCDYGPTVISIKTPDRKGKLDNILLTYPDIAGFENDRFYLNKLGVGQFANRIKNGQYRQPEGPYKPTSGIVQLETNDNGHTLHGGKEGWDKRMWSLGYYGSDDYEASVSFSLHKPHLDQGFPGNVYALCTVRLRAWSDTDGDMVLEYIATSDIDTPVNLTFHGYFQLDGANSGNTIHGLEFRTNAGSYLAVDKESIPTGEMPSVYTGDKGRFSFREKTKIGESNRFQETGFDHCLIFPKRGNGFVALYSPSTGRIAEMLTSEHAFQFYTGNYLGSPFKQFGGLCLEAQTLVDIVNHPEWWPFSQFEFTGGIVPYKQQTTYKFYKDTDMRR